MLWTITGFRARKKMSVLEAIKMRESGFEASRICEVLEENKMNASIYIAVDTVEY